MEASRFSSDGDETQSQLAVNDVYESTDGKHVRIRITAIMGGIALSEMFIPNEDNPDADGLWQDGICDAKELARRGYVRIGNVMEYHPNYRFDDDRMDDDGAPPHDASMN